MKKYLLLLLLLPINAQDVRFIDEVFDEVSVTENIVYGNAPDLPFIFLFEWRSYKFPYYRWYCYIKQNENSV